MKIAAEYLFLKNKLLPACAGISLFFLGACGASLECNRVETQYGACLDQLAQQDPVFFTESQMKKELLIKKELRSSCDSAETDVNNALFYKRIKCLTQLSGDSCSSAGAFQAALVNCYSQ